MSQEMLWNGICFIVVMYLYLLINVYKLMLRAPTATTQEQVSVTVTSGESGCRLRELQTCIVHKLCNGTQSKNIVVNGLIERIIVLQVEGLPPAT